MGKAGALIRFTMLGNLIAYPLYRQSPTPNLQTPSPEVYF